MSLPFGSRIGSTALADWCRKLRHQLAAGIAPGKALATAGRSGPPALQELSQKMAVSVDAGRPLADGLDGVELPNLFAPLLRVGEETGNLPEVLGDLEDYLREEERFVRAFRQQAMLPTVQLFAAIFVVAGLIWILGAIAGSRGTSPIAIFGLSGGTGALTFLLFTLGPIGLLAFLWKRGSLGPVLRRLPGMAGVVEAVTLHRLALGLQHTLNSSLPLAKALRLSFDATGDAEFARTAEPAIAAVKKRGTLHAALATCPQLPSEFLDLIAAAEEGGTVPELMKHQASHYRELAHDRMKSAGKLWSLAIWFVIAGFIILCIFRVASIYLSALGI